MYFRTFPFYPTIFYVKSRMCKLHLPHVSEQAFARVSISTYAHMYLLTHVPMCACAYVHMYLCTHVPMYTCTYVHMYLSTYVPKYAFTYVHMYICSHVPMCTCTYVPMYTCTYVQMYLCVYLCTQLSCNSSSVSNSFLFCRWLTPQISAHPQVRQLFLIETSCR